MEWDYGFGMCSTGAFTGQMKCTAWADASLDRLSHRSNAWTEIVVEEDRARMVEARRRSCETGVDYHEIYRVRWRDGSIYWIESQGKCLRDSEGKVFA